MRQPRLLHHKKIEDSDACVYCLETWPCETALRVAELSDWIKDHASEHMRYQREAMEYVAALISPYWKQERGPQ